MREQKRKGAECPARNPRPRYLRKVSGPYIIARLVIAVILAALLILLIITDSMYARRVDDLEQQLHVAKATVKTRTVTVEVDRPVPVADFSKSAEKPKKQATTKQSSTTKRIYFYCACAKCCGKATGITASGKHVKEGRTCASSDYPFGTKLYIKGVGYRVVEDTGCPSGSIDVYVDSHKQALKNGTFIAKVTVVK